MSAFRLHRRAPLLAAVVLALVSCTGPISSPVRAGPTFAAEIELLSEPGGYFDTDNLISNERSYLHVIDDLRATGVRGGAYLGVGPDQNFSYIAHLRPTVAYIVDIRRDNMLQHLLFKALFSLAETRIEYLSLLFGRSPPDAPESWRTRSIEMLCEYLDSVEPRSTSIEDTRKKIDDTIARFGVPLSDADRRTIDRVHRTFIEAGLDLRFHSAGRPPRFYYPTYRELLLETDRAGTRANYLATEAAYQVVRALQQSDRVIPVVGDLAGDHALRAIARALGERRARVSMFYTSNVEYYLFQEGRFRRFLANLSRLPRSSPSVIGRAVFGSTAGWIPGRSVKGYYSTSLIQPIEDLLDGFAAGRYSSYWDLIPTR